MSPSKRDKAAQKKRDQIIQATMHLLLKKGSSASASTTDICAAAKLTRPTLYHYFGSKRNLLVSVHMETLERDLKPYMAEAISIEDPLERLTFMVRAYTKNICLRPELRALIHDTLTMKDKHFREVRGEWKKHYILLRDTIAQLQAKGAVNTENRPSWTALFVLGMLTWATYWFDSRRKDNIDNITDLAVELVLNGLGYNKASPNN